MEQVSKSVRDETKAKFDALLKAALTKNTKNKSKSTQQLIDDNERNVSDSLEEKVTYTEVKASGTKAKFDALLKTALNKHTKNKSKSTQQLIEDETSFNLEEKTLTEETGILDIQDDVYDSKSFILNKFLNSSEERISIKHGHVEVEHGDARAVFKEPPVPKPRKSKIKSNTSSSNNTYSVKSATVFNAAQEDSGGTDKTFRVPKPRKKVKKDSPSSDSSAKTYDVAKPETVGDILVHSSPHKAVNNLTVIAKEPEESKVVEKGKRFEIVDETSKSKKKNRKKNTTADERIDEIQSNISLKSRRSNKSVDDAETDEKEAIDLQPIASQIEYENEIKPKPRLKKMKSRKQEETSLNESTYKYEKIINIVVHKTDRLELNMFVIHPVVKIHIVDCETGEYLKKTDKNRAAVFYMEGSHVTYLLPVITQNFNLQENRCLSPEWEETVIINEDFEYLISTESKVIIFFEILDFVAFPRANLESADTSRGWHRIAWAFLKVVGKNNALNIDKKLRLQLYRPGRPCKEVPSKCSIFSWWVGKKLTKYRSTLYVAVKGALSPDKVIETFRSKTPLQNEKGSVMQLDNDLKLGSGAVAAQTNFAVEESTNNENFLPKFEYKTCRLPDRLLAQLDGEEEGCFVLKFSHSGLNLAAAVFMKNMYNILVFSVLDFEDFYNLPSHQGLVYNISWSKDDALLISSSADGTVCIWDLEKLHFLQMLPHPSFVYWCEIAHNNIIATCCYDNILRIWTPNNTGDKFEYVLHDELEAHNGYVTCACFSKGCSLLLSSDSAGNIVEWRTDNENSWYFSRELKIPELRDVIINQIILHKKEKRLIIHARDNILRILDIKSECVIHWLEGAENNRVRTLCCVTPCFTNILTGDENGVIHVWNFDTGKSVATYHPYSNFSTKDLPIHCVDYNPKQNILAFSHYGHNVPIRVYVNDQDEKADVDLRVTSDVSNRSNKSGDSAKTDDRRRRSAGSTSDRSEKRVNLQRILEKIDKIIG